MTGALILLALLVVTGVVLKLTHRPDNETEQPDTSADQEACCGMHITCEKDTLVAFSDHPEYFDDEELDRYAGTPADEYTEQAIDEFRDVLFTLPPDEIAAWARSLTIRGITLPSPVRDELLMIVAEARQQKPHLTMLFDYSFFRYALTAIVIVSAAAAVVGTYVMTRRLVSLAGGVTHACFGGLGLGYFLGINPVFTAAVVAVGASLGVEWAAQRGRVRSDSAVAVVWALGMALGVLFVFLTPGYVPELNSFLFGNILTVSRTDLLIFAVYTAILLTYCAWRYKLIVATAFDPDFARVLRLPVRRITSMMTLLTAVGIVLTIRLAGVMLLMSMLTLPPMIAERFTRRMLPMAATAIAVSVAGGVGGLMLSTIIDVPCSALIVITLGALYLLSLLRKPS